MRRREFDPSWCIIRGASALRLIVIGGTCVRLP
jgi:hypothetical protein